MALQTRLLNSRPPFVAGRNYSTFLAIGSGAAVFPNKDIIYFLPFLAEWSWTFTAGVVRLTTGQAGGAMKVGIWANSSVSNRPLGAPVVVDNTGVDCSGSAADLAPALSGTLTPGWYWEGFKATATTTLPSFNSASSSQWMAWAMGTSTAANPIGNTVYSFADSYANSLPTLTEGATFGVVSTNLPILHLTT